MRAVSAIYAAGLIAMIAISASSFIIASIGASSEIQRARERAIGLEASRAMERLDAKLSQAGIEVRNLGPAEATVAYVVYSDGRAINLGERLRPGESKLLPLEGEGPLLVTGLGNLIVPEASPAADGQTWRDARLLASRRPLIYDSGLLFFGNGYGPFSLPEANGKQYERPIFASDEMVYTLNLDESGLYLRAYDPLPLADREVIALPSSGEAGYVFETGWGYVLATVDEYPYAREFIYRILAWNGSDLVFMGEHRFTLPTEGTYPIAAFNGTHIIELKVDRGTSHYRILKPYNWGLVVVGQGTFYIPSSGFPNPPYVENYRQTATIAALAKGRRLVIASMDGNFRLYLTSVDMSSWTAIGDRPPIYGYRALPGLALLSEGRLLVFEQNSRALLFDLDTLSILVERALPFTEYEPVPGHWFGFNGSDVWFYGPPCTSVFYTEMYTKYFGLYLLGNGTFAITTAAGAETFDESLQPLGIVYAGGPVKQAHLCNDGWRFVVLEPGGGVRIVAGG